MASSIDADVTDPKATYRAKCEKDCKFAHIHLCCHRRGCSEPNVTTTMMNNLRQGSLGCSCRIPGQHERLLVPHCHSDPVCTTTIGVYAGCINGANYVGYFVIFLSVANFEPAKLSYCFKVPHRVVLGRKDEDDLRRRRVVALSEFHVR